MNIVLVTIAECTSEVRICKAMEANNMVIRNQFLFQSIIIGQLGRIVGIALGIIIGNLMSVALNIDFIIPWNWIILGVIVCLVVGLVSGLMPAIKASKLDPIDSLRYE